MTGCIELKGKNPMFDKNSEQHSLFLNIFGQQTASMKTTILAIAIIFMALYSPAQDLKVKLDNSYTAFSDAVKARDIQKVQKALCTYAFAKMKNDCIASGSKFPDVFLDFAPKMLIDLSKLKHVRAESKGPTAVSIYTGNDKFGTPTVYVFKFLEENKEWKFNQVQTKQSEEISKKLKEGKLDFITGEKYQADGVMPQTPEPLVMSDYVASLDISGNGYEVDVTINGVLQKKAKGGSYSGAIAGGIKKGSNTIVIKTTPIKGAETSTVRVGIRALIKETEKDVFSFSEDSPAPISTKEFVVN
jgi:hypothetical protein